MESRRVNNGKKVIIKTGLPRALSVMLTLAVLLLACTTLLDVWIDSFSKPMLSRAADLLFDVSVAYIVAYMFYYLTVQLKYNRELPGRMKYVLMRLDNILRSADLLESELILQAKAHGIHMDSPPTKQQLESLARNINPQEAFTKISDAYDSSVNWFDAINIIFDQINESRQEIILLSPEIDIELVGMLDDLTDSSLSRLARIPRKDSVKNIIGWDFDRFFSAARKVREYREELDNEIAKREK